MPSYGLFCWVYAYPSTHVLGYIMPSLSGLFGLKEKDNTKASSHEDISKPCTLVLVIRHYTNPVRQNITY
ncbi:MAG: hypothetical protein FJ041_00385 [Candidatus Cloacimonetes bacterium]|nr:hypothetical protein [Candidatus Cloacimonadota bacterium]